MRMYSKILLLLLGCVPMAGQAALSAYTSTGQLQEWCAIYADGLEWRHPAYPDPCSSFIMGVTDAHQRLVYDRMMPPYFCGPGGVSRNRLVEIVLTYMKIDRVDLKRDAAATVLNAVRAAYPCDSQEEAG